MGAIPNNKNRGNKGKANKGNHARFYRVRYFITQPTYNYINKKLQERIMDMIHNPNDTWKLARQYYLMR